LLEDAAPKCYEASRQQLSYQGHDAPESSLHCWKMQPQTGPNLAANTAHDFSQQEQQIAPVNSQGPQLPEPRRIAQMPARGQSGRKTDGVY